MKNFKKFLPDILAVLFFVAIAFVYFFPADIEGRILFQHDSSAGIGAGQEILQHMEKTGERTRWTNGLFSGMPTYQLSPSYKSTNTVEFIEHIYQLGLKQYVMYLFLYMLGFYLLLRAFDFRQYLAALGAVIWAFSTYFLIIIAAGHIWKVMALAYLPPLIAGIVLAYRGKYIWGLLFTGFFSILEIKANHVQMTYYYLFVIFLILIVYLIEAIRHKQLAHFAKATAACMIGALLGILANLPNLYHTWEYGQESMRGKSELVKAQSANQTNSGLERDYITNYSYGIGETWSLLIPNIKGGASDRLLGKNPVAQKEGNSHFFSTGSQQIPYLYIYNQMPQYWNESTLNGKQPGTSGPVYVGAFVMLLFILGIFIVKNPIKWALIAAAALSVMLAWGQNFMWLTNLFIDYVPMYAKFRAVESILVIAEFCIPLLAMLALKEIIEEPEVLTKKINYLYVSFGLTAGITLLCALLPSVFFNFTTEAEIASFQRILPADQVTAFIDNLQTVRKGIFTSDCWRSFAIILAGTLMLLLFKARKLKALPLTGILITLCLFDLWQVNKRYLNDEMFVPKPARETIIPKTATDETILQDKTLDYRVLNLASNTFNENETSYYHKSIGGYHAAKLRRYQELIEAHISPEMRSTFSAIAQANGDMTKVNGDSLFPVLNMLNARYFILPLQSGQTVPVFNPYTYGNAWFVDEVRYVDNANQELDALGQTPLRHVAVSDKKFEQTLGTSQTQDSVSKVVLKTYEPNKLTYEVNSSKGGVIAFSEIYYPGWTATVDGQETEIGRIDYVLRAIQVAPGEHEIVLSFFPKSIKITETIAYASTIILAILALVLIVGMEIKRRKKQ